MRFGHDRGMGMPDLWKLLHPVSLLVGLAVTAGVLAILWPFSPHAGVTLGLAIFLLAAGVVELIRRIVAPKAADDRKAKP